jgi:hypothetical protein
VGTTCLWYHKRNFSNELNPPYALQKSTILSFCICTSNLSGGAGSWEVLDKQNAVTGNMILHWSSNAHASVQQGVFVIICKPGVLHMSFVEHIHSAVSVGSLSESRPGRLRIPTVLKSFSVTSITNVEVLREISSNLVVVHWLGSFI